MRDGGEVQGLVEAEGAETAQGLDCLVVPPGSAGVDHRRQPGRIGCDHQIGGQPALQPQAGDAEIGILVGELDIPRVEAGFRDAPGHAPAAP